MGNYVSMLDNPLTEPDYRVPPKFDPMIGFPNGRKEREMIATKDEMDSAKLPPNLRDYCAHLLIDFKDCKAGIWPMQGCSHQKHALTDCLMEDLTIRIKEYERERRLMARSKRIEEKNSRALVE